MSDNETVRRERNEEREGERKKRESERAQHSKKSKMNFKFPKMRSRDITIII